MLKRYYKTFYTHDEAVTFAERSFDTYKIKKLHEGAEHVPIYVIMREVM